MPRSVIHRTDVDLVPDGVRVVGRPHVPGDDRRMSGIVSRVLRLTPEQVQTELADVRLRFEGRHRDLTRMLSLNAERVRHLLATADDDVRTLVGAVLTQEHAFQGAALTNPSMVPAPDQSGLPAGACRFVLSLRAISEGHISSIALRSGVVDADGGVQLDPAAPLAEDRCAPTAWARCCSTSSTPSGSSPTCPTRSRRCSPWPPPGPGRGRRGPRAG